MTRTRPESTRVGWTPLASVRGHPGEALVLWGLALSVAIVLTDPAPLPAQAYTLDDWLTVSQVGSFEWSPDGRTIFFTSNAAPSGTMEIFRVPAAGGSPVQVSEAPPGVRPEPKETFVLSPDGQTVFFTSTRSFQGFTNIYRMSVEGGPAEPLTFNDAVIQTSPAVSPDGHRMAFFARTGRGAKIYVMDLRDGPSWARLLLPGPEQERSPVWSPDGSIAFLRGGDIWVLDASGGEPRRVADAAYGAGNGQPVWSPDGRRIAFLRSWSGFSQVGVVDVATGAVIPITHEPNEHSDVAWSPDGQSLAFVRSDAVGMSRDVVLARSDGTGEPRTLTRGKGMRFVPHFSPDGRRIAYVECTSVRTRDLWIVPVDGGGSRQITHSMGRIAPARLSEADEVFYAGPDNLRIPTMLIRPPSMVQGRKYPVLVRLHGHPGQWNHNFDLMTQYFVSRGYVAVAPNPRGSRGFGQGFHDLHIADYGGMEFRDVMGVLPFLDSLGYVDMNRKATWGGSGGGYMSLVIATEAPQAFQAQIIRAPVSSWKLLAIDRFGASGRAWTAGRTPRRERSEFGGSYAEIPEEYDRRSPLNFVESVAVPQLLFHGLRDASVPSRQSQVWVDRMRELGKGDLVTYVEYPDEDHGLRRYKATVRDRLERMERFLGRHLELPTTGAGR